MNCINEEQLEKYVGGQLSETEPAQIETHLKTCQACAGRVVSGWLYEKHLPLAATGNSSGLQPGIEPDREGVWIYQNEKDEWVHGGRQSPTSQRDEKGHEGYKEGFGTSGLFF